MTSVPPKIGALLFCIVAILVALAGCETEEVKRDDGLSLKQTIMSADKIVKSLETDEKIARAVQNTKGDKGTAVRENLAAHNDNDEEDEESEDETGEGLEDDAGGEKERREDKPNSKGGPKIWDQWSKWSACSVTCGIGKITRWRHCVSGGCAAGEKEAQIKTCTLAAC